MLLNILQRVGYAALVIVLVTVGTTLLLSLAPGSRLGALGLGLGVDVSVPAQGVGLSLVQPRPAA